MDYGPSRPQTVSLVAWGVHEANVSSASVATGRAPRGYQVKVPYNISRRRDMLVLILVLSLDPKPKVVRPKTKTYFTKKVLVRCHWHLIPTLAPRGAFWKGRGRSAPTRTLPKTHPLLSPSAEVSAGERAGDSAAGPPGRDNLNLNIPYYSCIARSYYMHIYLAPKKVEKK